MDPEAVRAEQEDAEVVLAARLGTQRELEALADTFVGVVQLAAGRNATILALRLGARLLVDRALDRAVYLARLSEARRS